MTRALLVAAALSVISVGAGFSRLATPVLAAQNAPAAKPAEAPKPTPRTADGHPDLSGMWVERLPNDPNPATAAAPS